MTKISGVLTDGAAQPLNNCTLVFKSKKNNT
ncbi:prophage tail fiber N-terminal domain-containing protein [Gilliamella mensalis]|nr:prophage tail fiber N-terminal domain-containing protein [Gilliamella mensalis]